MKLAVGLASFSLAVLFAAPLLANPVVIEPGINLAPPFLLEALLVAGCTAFFGFSFLRMLLAWIAINLLSWIAMMLLFALLVTCIFGTGDHGPAPVLVSIAVCEIFACFAEAGVMLFLGDSEKMRPLRDRKFGFGAALPISVVANSASLVLGVIVLRVVP
jgi:hypothetical protein